MAMYENPYFLPNKVRFDLVLISVFQVLQSLLFSDLWPGPEMMTLGERASPSNFQPNFLLKNR
jgi:hypothetical protein